MGRREIRERVFWMLFRAEFYTAEELEKQYAAFEEELQDEEPIEIDGEALPVVRASERDRKEIMEKARRIADYIPRLDEQLNERMDNWTTNRVGKVELTVLRLALYEMYYDDTVTDAVAINEAVELVRKYGQDHSPEFINGVLAKFVRR